MKISVNLSYEGQTQERDEQSSLFLLSDSVLLSLEQQFVKRRSDKFRFTMMSSNRDLERKMEMRNERTNKETILTFAGLILMTILTTAKVLTGSRIAGSALIIAGIAFFFIVEAVAKTKDSDSGLSFPRFFTDLKKPGVVPLILFMIVLTLLEMFLAKRLFGNALAEHVLERAGIMSSTSIAAVLLNQVFVVLGEEIGFRGFFVGKGEKILPFWPVALFSAVVFAAAHYAAGKGVIVAWDLGEVFIDAVLYALIYRKSGNCLISCIPHFCNNMLGYFLVPIIFV